MNLRERCVVFLLFLVSAGAIAKEECIWPRDMPAPNIILVGEVHGTKEAPEFVGNLVCAAARRGTNVVVALEISSSQQQLIDSYLTSAGSRTDRLALLSGKFWTRQSQDGRSSRAMLNLIDRVRVLKRKWAGISIIAVDETANGSRDAGMAKHIGSAAGLPDTQVIALLGNYHASQMKGSNGNAEYEPAGYLLADRRPFSVLFSAQAGSAWACTPECGILSRKAGKQDGGVLGYLNGQSTKPGYDATYSVRSSTASLPAVSRGKNPEFSTSLEN